MLWLSWTLVTAIGWYLGWKLAWSRGLVPIWLQFGLVVAAVVSLAQGLVMWWQIRRAVVWWIVASFVGWVVAWIVGFQGIRDTVMAGVAMGAIVGIAQWLVLKERVKRADWWIIVSIVGWAVAEGVRDTVGDVLGPDSSWTLINLLVALHGTVGGLLTGIGLSWVMRNHQKERFG